MFGNHLLTPEKSYLPTVLWKWFWYYGMDWSEVLFFLISLLCPWSCYLFDRKGSSRFELFIWCFVTPPRSQFKVKAVLDCFVCSADSTSRCNIALAAELTLSPAGGDLLFPTLLPSSTTQSPAGSRRYSGQPGLKVIVLLLVTRPSYLTYLTAVSCLLDLISEKLSLDYYFWGVYLSCTSLLDLIDISF